MINSSAFTTLDWGQVDLKRVPHMPIPPPGPQSKHYHERCTKYFKGLSGQVKLFPVTFESGEGCVLKDVDGNEYIDFSSGIYVTTLGHCHPKISEAIAKYALQTDERPRLHHAHQDRCSWRNWRKSCQAT
jgi:4-aminobutyrate aminotransferase-like enzyme